MRAAELNYAVDQVPAPDSVTPATEESDADHLMLAKSYFDIKEYDRAAHYLQNCTSAKAYFLHMYSRYLAGPDNSADSSYLKVIRQELYKKYKVNELDGYALYLYGIVLRKLELLRDAVDVFVEALCKEPMLWSAWLELALLVTDKEMLQSLPVPEHWVKHFFIAHTYCEMQLNEEALEMYMDLKNHGFSKSTYVMAQIALAYHGLPDMDNAVLSFTELQKVDPYRLDNMDTYSNLLYIKELRMELAHLAHNCCDIDKYRVETCCVVGNYYSLRGQHEKAGLYFQRALRLNPHYLSAWTLLGHEYMELKNTSAAIQAYRHAIGVNQRDYRAWYGLGQTYEILKMPLYCLYYYRRAQALRFCNSI
ncbi:hypothetical protein CAPTEDRAFT_196146 [Capitella teleta]|uniref:Cdc23 domain-containing protein n=1 Tax=Capitella teleta TaxID=283909 RepID=R7U0D9_CAPTE|nr:hypothetical protein CAPTEDRAFT_196146 [Capitella teleta]|eukprot:ELT99459.1 hypothetical protein CAPTEDRAFT_196146 [Capitella teleta]